MQMGQARPWVRSMPRKGINMKEIAIIAYFGPKLPAAVTQVSWCPAFPSFPAGCLPLAMV